MKWRIAALLLLVLIAALLVWLLNSEWLEIDKCLDGGGRWDDANGTCQVATGTMT